MLKESHRCRTVFRRIGGFVYIMSVLVGLEGSLSEVGTIELFPDWSFASNLDFSFVETKVRASLLEGHERGLYLDQC